MRLLTPIRNFKFKTALTASALVLSACGDGVKYKYDVATGLCKNKKGEVGVNEKKLVECGLIQDQSSKYYSANKKGKSLMGLTVKNSSLSAADFEGADLRGARFEHTKGATVNMNLSWANLENANLEGTIFEMVPTLMASDFDGAQINEHTQFPIGFDNSIGYHVSTRGIKYSYSGKYNSAKLNGFSLAASTSTPLKDLIAVDLERLVSQGLLDISQAENADKFTETDPKTSTKNPLNYIVKRVPNWAINEKMGGGTIAFNTSSILFSKSLFQDLFTDANKIASVNNMILKNEKSIYAEDYNVSQIESTDLSAVKPTYKFNSTEYKMTSPEMGIGTFTLGYLGQQISQIERIATLVHESRHSDISIAKSTVNTYNDLVSQYRVLVKKLNNNRKDAINQDARNYVEKVDSFFDDTAAIKTTYWGELEVTKKSPDWGFLHTKCPSDIMGGANGACDDTNEGAYAVGRHLLVAIANTCTSCTEAEKEMARVAAIDAKSRYIGDRTSTTVRLRPASYEKSVNELRVDYTD
jgi:uncharacterized protein YjbI with pentapeptide repeats